MPTYDYECRACGHTFEHFQSMTSGVKRKCPQCGKLKLQRLIGAGAGIIFKGSGFYETDYKRKTPSSKAGTKPSESSTSPSTESGSEPASKSESKDAGSGAKKAEKGGSGK
jgi:putative FmdB family regulatory protein